LHNGASNNIIQLDGTYGTFFFIQMFMLPAVGKEIQLHRI